MRNTVLTLATAGILGIGIGAGSTMFSGRSAAPLHAGIEPAAAAAVRTAPEQTVINVTRQASPAVVGITTRGGSGSGVIIRADGVVLTNAHVVGSMRTVTVGLATGEELQGEVLGRDQSIDIAVVRVNAQNLPTAPLGDSDMIQVGQSAIAIGNPAGYERSVTTGVVSAVNRVLGPFDELIQTDAAINPGNSGGPLLDSSGRVIGINTAVLRGTGGGVPVVGIGFAVPINLARNVAEQLLTTGVIRRAFLGVRYLSVDREMVQQFRLPVQEGVIVQQVEARSPAQQAGVQAGDIITGIGGTTVRAAGDLQRFMRAQQPGATVRVTGVRRTGQQFSVEVRLGSMEVR
jgi:serine protease Do